MNPESILNALKQFTDREHIEFLPLAPDAKPVSDYAPTVEFSKILCNVPVNTADPIAWARALAQRELGLTEFSRCRVNGSRTMDERFQPDDGVGESGRLVILNPLSDDWKQWLRGQIP